MLCPWSQDGSGCASTWMSRWWGSCTWMFWMKVQVWVSSRDDLRGIESRDGL